MTYLLGVAVVLKAARPNPQGSSAGDPRRTPPLARMLSTIGMLICIALVLAMGPAWAYNVAAVDASSNVAGRAFVFPSASEPFRQGFVRVVNHSAWTGDVQSEGVSSTNLFRSARSK